MKTIDTKDHREISANEFRKYRKLLAKHLVKQYGISCLERKIVDDPSYYGSYNGRLILIKRDIGEDHKLFLVAHLFGHCVQYCSTHNAGISDRFSTSISIEDETDSIRDYEYEAARYGMALLTRTMPKKMDQWFADWSHADWTYFSTLRALNDWARPPSIEIIYGTPLITAKEIPVLSLTEFTPRYAY